MTSAEHRVPGIVLAGAAFVASCSATAPAKFRRPNHNGLVLVAEYHRVGPGRTPYDRSPAVFRKDLERLDKTGFRPVTARAWLAGKMGLPKGASPVVVTFDDAQPSQFQLRRDGTVDPRCAVGIWRSFAKTHPEFPVRATFFVLPMLWGQPEVVRTKVNLLRRWGCELANHTTTHPALRTLRDRGVAREVLGGAALLERLGERPPFTLAYPYGSTPQHPRLLKALRDKKGRSVVSYAFIAGAEPSPMPGTGLFSRWRIPRVQAVGGENGLNYWLDRIQRGETRPYVQ